MYLVRSKHKGIIGTHAFTNPPSAKQLEELGVLNEGDGWPMLVTVEIVTTANQSCKPKAEPVKFDKQIRLEMSGSGKVINP